jgi:hypothetical protein
MNNITMYVTAALRHKITIDVSNEELGYIRSLGEDELNDYIGDLTSHRTIDDGEFEDASFIVHKN